MQLSDYRSAVSLDDPTTIHAVGSWHTQIRPVLHKLGFSLVEEKSNEQLLNVLHGILATIDANVLDQNLLDAIETIAADVNRSKNTVSADTLPFISEQYSTTYTAANTCSLWVGDITRLAVDAIVNAANSELLGCRIPNHACIDNAIHSAAGPRLRDDCAEIIRLQGALESVGKAKITRAYALPASYVLHTVGPQIGRGQTPNDQQQEALAYSYRSCLEVAAEVSDIRSIAFCAISTGVFGYPRELAVQVALKTVRDWLANNPHRFDRIIFNLYSKTEAAIYEEALNAW